MANLKISRANSPTRTRARITAREFSNDDEMEMVISGDMQNIVDSVTEDIFDVFLSEYVAKYAYGGGKGLGGSNKWYMSGNGEPSGEFYNSWKIAFQRTTRTTVGSSIIYDPANMGADFDTWKHTSQIQGWGNEIPYMPFILNMTGSTSSLDWNYREKGFWDEFVKEIFDSGEIDRLFAAKLMLGL